MRRDELNLVDLTPVGFLLVLVTAGVVFASVLFLVSLLPHERVGHPEWVQHVARELLAVPVATIGVSFFWVCARVLRRFGFRLLRSPGEVQTVAIAFGLLLSLIGVPLSLANLVPCSSTTCE
jgi:hypothetical protein